jgi:hypothetical protein
MKKALKHFIAGCALLAVLTSCSVLSKAVQGSSIGSATGSALTSVIQILKSTGMLDLSNLGNIINLGTILTGASSLQGASSDFTNDFASGLISGSSNLINSSNVTGVLNALKSLANTDTSALQRAASAASSGNAFQVSNSTAGVPETLAALNTIASLVK